MAINDWRTNAKAMIDKIPDADADTTIQLLMGLCSDYTQTDLNNLYIEDGCNLVLPDNSVVGVEPGMVVRKTYPYAEKYKPRLCSKAYRVLGCFALKHKPHDFFICLTQDADTTNKVARIIPVKELQTDNWVGYAAERKPFCVWLSFSTGEKVELSIPQ